MENNSQANSQQTKEQSGVIGSTGSKTLIGVGIGLVALFGVAIIGLGVAGVILVSLNSSPSSSITVDASATEKVKPDTAIASFVFSQEGEDAAVLNTQADEALQKITDYLTQNGISRDDIVTNKTTYPNYNYTPDGLADETGLIAEVSFEVTFRDLQDDLSKPNEIMSGLVGLGVNRFYGYRYAVENTDDVCANLENKAIEKAYQTAEDRVDSLGGGRIISREVQPLGGTCGDDSYGYPLYATEDKYSTSMGSDSTTAPELTIGTQELSARASVVVTYK